MRHLVSALADTPVQGLVDELQKEPTYLLGQYARQKAEAMQEEAELSGIRIEIKPMPSSDEWLDGYNASSISRALGLEGFADGLITDRTVLAIRLVFKPSFHPEATITIVDDDSAPCIALRSADHSLWACYSDTQSGQPRPAPAPVPFEERHLLDADQVDRMRDVLQQAEPHRLRERPRSTGIDGMGVDCLVFDHDPSSFEIWSPRAGTDAHCLLAGIYSLAVETMVAEPSIFALENLHGYLDLGLGVKVAPGNPYTVRLFGGLSSRDEEQIEAILDAVPACDPLLMDLRRCGFIPDMLHEVMRRFAERPGNTVWVGHPSLPLRQILCADDDIFDDMALAKKWLAEGTL